MKARQRFPLLSFPALAATVLASGAGALAGPPDSRPARRPALVFLIAGQSNAQGVAAFSPQTNAKSGLAKRHPTIPGSTAKEVGLPTTRQAYPRSFIWSPSEKAFQPLAPGKNLLGGYHDPNRHGIELPMAWRLEKLFPDRDKYFIKCAPGGCNLYEQWNPARKNSLFHQFMQRYHGGMVELKKRHGRIRVLALYWDQGESDRPQAKQYEANLRALLSAFRKQTGIGELTVFLRKHLFQYGDKSFEPIVTAQVDVARGDPNVHLLDLDRGSNEANFKAWAWTDRNGHLSSKAYLELTRRILDVLLPGAKRDELDLLPSAGKRTDR